MPIFENTTSKVTMSLNLYSSIANVYNSNSQKIMALSESWINKIIDGVYLTMIEGL